MPVLRWPGGCFADEYHWMDGIGPREQRPDDDQHALGRRDREQPLRHARVHGPVRAARLRAVHLRQRRQRHRAGDAAVGRIHHLRRRQPDGRPAPQERPRGAVEADVLRRRQRELGLRRQHDARVLRRPVPPLRDLRAATSASNRVFKIACGPNGGDYQLDRGADARGRPADGRPGAPLLHAARAGKSRSATQFDEADWFAPAPKRPAHGRPGRQALRRSWTSTTRRSASA